MSSKFFVLSFLVLLINSSASTESPSIKEIVAFVGDNACDCDIQVTVCGPDMDRCCTTNKLDNGGINDFELGQADRFSGEVLGDCDGFVIGMHEGDIHLKISSLRKYFNQKKVETSETSNLPILCLIQLFLVDLLIAVNFDKMQPIN